MTDTYDPSTRKSAQTISVHDLVRDMMEATHDAVEHSRIALESSRRRLTKKALNLDLEPTGNRIRESF